MYNNNDNTTELHQKEVINNTTQLVSSYKLEYHYNAMPDIFA